MRVPHVCGFYGGLNWAIVQKKGEYVTLVSFHTATAPVPL